MISDSKGFSLTELIIVIALIGIMLSIASLSFDRMQRKSGIENQAKELMTDLNDLRMQAIHTKSNHAAILSANRITFRRYSSEEPVTPTTGTPLSTKSLKFQISKSPTALQACNDIAITSRGYTQDRQTIFILPTGSGALYDCVVVHNARINLGQTNGTDCDFK